MSTPLTPGEETLRHRVRVRVLIVVLSTTVPLRNQRNNFMDM